MIASRLDCLQRNVLADLPGRISTIALHVPGSHTDRRVLSSLQKQLPRSERPPSPPILRSPAKIYSRISGLLPPQPRHPHLTTSASGARPTSPPSASTRRHDESHRWLRARHPQSFSDRSRTSRSRRWLHWSCPRNRSLYRSRKAVFGIAAAPRLIVFLFPWLLPSNRRYCRCYPLRRLAQRRARTIFRGDA